jgi:hypothetical protein
VTMPDETRAIPPAPEALDAYLDGLLEGADLEAFEAAMAADPALRAEVELQRRIDAALRRHFALPEAPALHPPAAGAGSRYWNTPRLLAAAAIILLVAGITIFGLVRYIAADHPLVRVYRTEVARGLKPAWVCDTDEQLVAYLEDKYGRGLTVRGGDGIDLIGWTSCTALSPYTAVLMTRVDGEPVFVLVDLLASDRDLSLPWLSGLHLFRRELGGMVLYELTPRAAPVLLDRFAEPPPRG